MFYDQIFVCVLYLDLMLFAVGFVMFLHTYPHLFPNISWNMAQLHSIMYRHEEFLQLGYMLWFEGDNGLTDSAFAREHSSLLNSTYYASELSTKYFT